MRGSAAGLEKRILVTSWSWSAALRLNRARKRAEAELRVQIQTDPRYFNFLDRAEVRNVMDFQLPVARIEDILQGNIRAALDEIRPQSKRQKDLADIARIIEVSPELRSRVPAELLSKLL